MHRLTLIILLWSYSTVCFAQSLEEDLTRLDHAIEMSKNFEDVHTKTIKGIEDKLSSEISLQEAYKLYDDLYQSQKSYSFDFAKAAIDKKEEIAIKLADKQKISETAVDKAFLYCVAGLYLESQNIEEQIDTNLLSPNKLIEYYNYKQRYFTDFPEYSRSEKTSLFREKVIYYRQQIIEKSYPNDYINRLARVRNEIDQGKLEIADSLSTLFLSSMDVYSHNFAELSYYKAIICNRLGRADETLHWFTVSAIADIRSNTKDNASLQSLAIELLNRQEFIDKAFRYTQHSLSDAVFYNAKLRPWQIAMSLPAIEKAYMDNIMARQKSTRIFQVSLICFVILMLAAILWLVSLYSKQNRNQREIKTMNSKLQIALEDLSKANAAKEEYLGLFLSMCSSYMDKLKKYTSYNENEAEIEAFYNTFDNAFIQLYPDFVEKFNALLIPEARIKLKKDERLNTELRIFALIKLGITGSSHIASLLRYSVNTIYNYRAQIKNAAIEGKETFEERVKMI